jgi:predicted SAM-dependent methyltransferase
MEPNVRVDLERILAEGRPLRLDLGCGRKPREGFLGVDRLELPGVDIVADVERGLPFLPDDSVDEIHSKSFLEHVVDLEGVLREIVRVLKPEGRCYLFVPHFSNPYYWHDYTHRTPFGLHTLSYFSEEEHQHLRKVPAFYTEVRLRVRRVRIVFKSHFALLRPFKKLLTGLVNLSRWTQAFYEENLVWLLPAYGLEIWFTPAGKGADTSSSGGSSG